MRLEESLVTVDYTQYKDVIENDAVFRNVRCRRAVPMRPSVQEALQQDGVYKLSNDIGDDGLPLISLPKKMRYDSLPKTTAAMQADVKGKRVKVVAVAKAKVLMLYMYVENPQDKFCDTEICYRVFPRYGIFLEVDRIPTSHKIEF